jgi:hypothetical protein
MTGSNCASTRVVLATCSLPNLTADGMTESLHQPFIRNCRNELPTRQRETFIRPVPRLEVLAASVPPASLDAEFPSSACHAGGHKAHWSDSPLAPPSSVSVPPPARSLRGRLRAVGLESGGLESGGRLDGHVTQKSLPGGPSAHRDPRPSSSMKPSYRAQMRDGYKMRLPSLNWRTSTWNRVWVPMPAPVTK